MQDKLRAARRPAYSCAAPHRENARPGQTRDSDNRRRLAAARHLLRRHPGKLSGLAHILIVSADEFGEAVRCHLLGRGNFETMPRNLSDAGPRASRGAAIDFLQFRDDRGVDVPEGARIQYSFAR